MPAGAVQETRSYLFELYDAAAGADTTLLIDDTELEGLRPRNGAVARWRWSPGFNAGTVEAELRIAGRAAQRFEIVTDPDLRKLTRDDFDAMVREILDDTFALFALSSFRKGVARGTGNRPPPLARLEFLRSRVAELEEAASAIARRPRRILAAEDQVLPYYRAVRATGPEIIRSLRSGRQIADRIELAMHVHLQLIGHTVRQTSRVQEDDPLIGLGVDGGGADVRVVTMNEQIDAKLDERPLVIGLPLFVTIADLNLERRVYLFLLGPLEQILSLLQQNSL